MIRLFFAAALSFLLGVTSVSADAVSRQKEFNYKRDVSGKADFDNIGSSPDLLFKHPIGNLKFSIRTKNNVEHLYTRNGRGDPVPVNILVALPLRKNSNPVRKYHRKIKPHKNYALVQPIWAPQNETAIINYAKILLAQTHCRGGRVVENYNHVFQGKRWPMVSRTPPGSKYTPGWVVRLTCDLYRTAG